MREKFYRFMQGRYGNDELSKFLVGVSMVLIILNLLTKSGIFNLLFWVCLIYSYFRMFSKNYSARYAENQKYLALKNKWSYKWENHKRMREQKRFIIFIIVHTVNRKSVFQREKALLSLPARNANRNSEKGAKGCLVISS